MKKPGDKPTFYQRAAQQLKDLHFKAQHAKLPGMFVHEEHDIAVVLKNSSNATTFKGYPRGVCALVVNEDGQFPLLPVDFKKLGA